MKTVLMMLLIAGSINAQNSNVAYISRDTIMKSIPGHLEKIKQAEEMAKSYNEELKAKRENLAERFNLLLKPYNVKPNETEPIIRARMSVADTTSLGMLQQEDKLIQSTERLYAAKVKSTYDQEVKPVNERIMAAIRRYAVKNKLDMVYFLEDIAGALAYLNTKKSVTKAVIRELTAGS